MAKTLYLTAEEKKLFDALSKELQGEWEVSAETMTFEDTEEDRQTRLDLAHISDPAFLELKEKARGIENPEELEELARGIDPQSLSDSDTAQILFALGPDGMTAFLVALLPRAESAEDVEQAASFSVLRHEWLASVPPAP